MALLDDRNAILAASIRAACARASAQPAGAAGTRAVVAVLGMAHVNGVVSLLGDGAALAVADSSEIAARVAAEGAAGK